MGFETASTNHGHIPGLDGVRGVAIALVLLAHCVIYGERRDPYGPASLLDTIGFASGNTGVVIFFVLSGFLITTLLLREEARTGGVSLRLFYWRRSLRLFPALWLYLAVVATLCVGGLLPHHPWHSFLTSFLYVRNLAGRGHETDHLWSLSIEEQFYVLWPLVFVCLAGRDRARLLVAATGLAAVTAWRVYATRNGLASVGALYNRSDFRFDAPLFGCVLALLVRVAPGAISWANASPRRAGMTAATGVAALAAWVGLGLHASAYPGTDSSVICLIGATLVASQIGASGASNRWLASAPLAILGRISYGLYLWQQLFLGPRIPSLEVIRDNPLVGLLATFAAAGTSYVFVERPILRLKDRKFHKPGL